MFFGDQPETCVWVYVEDCEGTTMDFNGYGGGIFTFWLGRVSPHRKMFCLLSLKTHIFTLVIIVSIKQ